MSGKGDRDRTADRKAFRENFDAIDWGSPKPPSRLRSVKRVEGPDGDGYEVFVPEMLEKDLARLSDALDRVESGDPADLLRELGRSP